MALRRNVLIFHQAALGDFVLTWPLAMAAARLFAQSRVTYITHAQKGALAERLLRVESVDADTGGWHALYSDKPHLSAPATKLLSGAHLVLSFVCTDQDHWQHNVREIAGDDVPLICLQTKPPETSDRHVTEYIVDQLSSLPALQGATMQMLNFFERNGLMTIAPAGGAPVIIHPGAGAARKCWPADRFVSLARIFASSGADVRFVIGEVEREQWSQQRVADLHRVCRIEQPQSYLELFELIRQARLFIGNDSGPTHLAAMCGVKTVALFGTDPTRWRPIGPQLRILRGDSIDSIPLDEVVGAASAAK